MQDSPTSVTAPHASLRHKKGEADEGGPQWGGCHDAPLTQAPRPSYEMRPSPSRDLLWGLQNSPSRAQLQAPRFRTDRWGDQTPLPPHQATTITSRSDQAMGGQRPAFVEKFATAPPIPSHAYCASDLPRQPRELDRGLVRLQQRGNEVGNIFPLQGRGTYIMLPSCDNAQPHRTAASQARQMPTSDKGADAARERLQRLRFALVNYDRTRQGVLPSSAVTQFAKLHGVWADHTVQWPQLLLQSEPPGMSRRVDYAQLLQHLAR